MVSEHGSNGRFDLLSLHPRISEIIMALGTDMDSLDPDIPEHDYEIWNRAYDRGYKNGRDNEAKRHTGLELTVDEVRAILRFASKIGYISHEQHEDFHILLRRLQDEGYDNV